MRKVAERTFKGTTVLNGSLALRKDRRETSSRDKVRLNGTAPRICFIDQTGELGGAELCLLDIVTNFKDHCEVILFTEGPFRKRLEERGIAVKVMVVPDVILGIKRHGCK